MSVEDLETLYPYLRHTFIRVAGSRSPSTSS